MSLHHAADEFSPSTTLHPVVADWLQRSESVSGFIGLSAIVMLHGFHVMEPHVGSLLAASILIALFLPLASVITRYTWSLTKSTFLKDNAGNVLLFYLWLTGLLMLSSMALMQPSTGISMSRLFGWGECIVFCRGILELLTVIQWIAQAGWNPAMVLASSFVALITFGMLILMLPLCRPEDQVPADWLTALFTATSACCVTGLVAVDTATYWSRVGQCVILMLIQVGGLGIMTFGAFFAMAVSNRGSIRETATMRDLLESEQLSNVGRLVRSIVGLTVGIELMGALLLSGLWADQPWSEMLFQSLFHSVSAFCNAGFSTRGLGLNMEGWELRWQVWCVLAGLIILGGFGFTALDNLWHAAWTRRWFRQRIVLPRAAQSVRLSLTTKLVCVTTIGLLVGGTLLMFVLEWNSPRFPSDTPSQLANAWFHSVTLRTAGFNTINHAELQPTAKLLGIMLMFVGASPGSTGGGVKTTCLALAILTLRAVLKGRTTVEVWGRTIPEVQVYRGLAVMALGLTVLMISSLGLIIIENQPERVIDHLYETASALGTVGVSAGVTAGLQPASKLLLIVTMFLGRVGAITLMAALAGTRKEVNYEYPEERIGLG